MAKINQKEFNTDIIKTIFQINENISITKQEINFLFDLEKEILELFETEGESCFPSIIEQTLDEILRRDFKNLSEYLGIEINENIKNNLNNKLNDESFKKIEQTENSEDFFKNYLLDDVINDIIMSLKGYERKSDGAKEIFIKKRSAIIPTRRIDAINNILISNFNKINFLSQKEDIEQAKLILLAYSLVFEILLEIHYDCCDTQKTIEILGMLVLKLSNLIGLSKDFRTQLMTTVEASYKSELRKRENEVTSDND